MSHRGPWAPARWHARRRETGPALALILEQRGAGTHIGWNAPQHTLEVIQGYTYRHTAAADAIFTNGRLVGARSFFDDRNGPANFTQGLEITQQDHGVGQVGDVD